MFFFLDLQHLEIKLSSRLPTKFLTISFSRCLLQLVYVNYQLHSVIPASWIMCMHVCMFHSQYVMSTPITFTVVLPNIYKSLPRTLLSVQSASFLICSTSWISFSNVFAICWFGSSFSLKKAQMSHKIKSTYINV